MKQFSIMITLLILLLLLHDPVIFGTKNGLLLWYQTLVPSLLPFILVTNAMSETNAYYAIAKHFPGNHSKIYEIIAIILGNLCGYPIGGKILSDFSKNHCISSEKANIILPLASQASPMFLLGYVYNNMLENKLPLSVFLLSIYLPVVLYYIVLCIFSKKNVTQSKCIAVSNINITDTFIHAVDIMVMIGVYVIIFSILLAILLPVFHSTLPQIVMSFFEITTGLSVLNTLHIDEPFHTSLLCTLCAFGGMCSAFQVKGVLEYHNNNIKKYLLNKCILSAGTFFITYVYSLIN